MECSGVHGWLGTGLMMYGLALVRSEYRFAVLTMFEVYDMRAPRRECLVWWPPGHGLLWCLLGPCPMGGRLCTTTKVSPVDFWKDSG